LSRRVGFVGEPSFRLHGDDDGGDHDDTRPDVEPRSACVPRNELLTERVVGRVEDGMKQPRDQQAARSAVVKPDDHDASKDQDERFEDEIDKSDG